MSTAPSKWCARYPEPGENPFYFCLRIAAERRAREDTANHRSILHRLQSFRESVPNDRRKDEL